MDQGGGASGAAGAERGRGAAALDVGVGDRAREQGALGVGVRGPREKLLRWPLFEDLALEHHRHPVGEVAYGGQFVRRSVSATASHRIRPPTP